MSAPLSALAHDEVADLRARLAEAERVAEARARVVGHVAHEFRTPLSSILGFAALLAADDREVTAERRREYVDIIHRSARHLLHVVNDILNLTKVEAGTLEVTLAAVHAGQIAAAVVDSLHTVAADRGITLRLSDGGAPLALADAGRLRQVLLNLMDNAIKYSASGTEVEVSVREDGGEVCLEVRDEGPGLTAADQELIFREFSRIHHPGTRVSGAGLGLALAKDLTEAMGGRIGVRSRVGEGSTFWIVLPQADASARPAAAPALPLAQRDTRGEVVAVVDDDEDIRAFVAAVLERSGYTVHADDGCAGVAERLASARPLAVLLDLNLTDRTGAEVLRELRALDGMRRTPILAFTAAVGEADRAGALAAGFDGHVAKPVEPDQLVARVDDAVAEARRRAATPAPPPAPTSADTSEDEFWGPLRARFRAGLPARLADLEAALSAGDAQAVRRHLHKLRGTSAGYGFTDLSHLAGAAEDALRAGIPLADAPEVAAAVEALRGEV
ncbi:MAG TPA: ATP-binding protein [Longimicrobium sp.]